MTARLAPTPVPSQIARFDTPLLIAVSTLLLLFARTGRRLDRTEGSVFLALYLVYVGYLVAA